MSPGFGFLFMIAFAFLFYRIAEMEGRKGVLWACMSVLIYLVGEFYFRLWWFPIFLLQGLLFGAMTGLNMIQKRRY